MTKAGLVIDPRTDSRHSSNIAPIDKRLSHAMHNEPKNFVYVYQRAPACAGLQKSKRETNTWFPPTESPRPMDA